MQTANGEPSCSPAVSINTKGASLSFIFKKWFGNNPNRKVISSGVVTDDGKGNLLVNLKYVMNVAVITAVIASALLFIPLLAGKYQAVQEADNQSTQESFCQQYQKADLKNYPQKVPANCVSYLSSKK